MSLLEEDEELEPELGDSPPKGIISIPGFLEEEAPDCGLFPEIGVIENEGLMSPPKLSRRLDGGLEGELNCLKHELVRNKTK